MTFANAHNCEACPVARNVPGLEKLGVKMDRWDYVVALAGNPNTGKSTVFNNLTGLRQHTGNWPGKTIARAEGGFAYQDVRYKMVDLPGTYSLLSASEDEEVARNFILFGRPDVTVVVVDATMLERNLNLALQVLQITDRVVVCLNLMDEARTRRISIDVRGLARDLGVPVVPCAARSREGMEALVAEVSRVAKGELVCRPHRLRFDLPGLKDALERLTARVAGAFPGLRQAPWVALRLLEGDDAVREAVRSGEIGELSKDHGATLLRGEAPSAPSPEGIG